MTFLNPDMHHRGRRFPIGWLMIVAACAGAPPTMPPGEGPGVVQFDAEAPAGAVQYQRPEWKVGDAFVLLRGERLRGEFKVTRIEDGAYVLDVGTGTLLRRDRDLGNLGEWSAASGEPMHLLSPVDARYHWPLWVGKHWTCEFLDRTVGGPAIPMQASYFVEALDHIDVAAGSFDALRIVRNLRLLTREGTYLTRSQIAWYAPAVGVEVRQLVGDTMVDLVEVHRGS